MVPTAVRHSCDCAFALPLLQEDLSDDEGQDFNPVGGEVSSKTWKGAESAAWAGFASHYFPGSLGGSTSFSCCFLLLSLLPQDEEDPDDEEVGGSSSCDRHTTSQAAVSGWRNMRCAVFCSRAALRCCRRLMTTMTMRGPRRTSASATAMSVGEGEGDELGRYRLPLD